MRGSNGQRLATDVTKTAALDFRTEQPEAAKTPIVQEAVRIHEYDNPDSRLVAVASEYANHPDPAERDELTQLIRGDLYAQGKLRARPTRSPSSLKRRPGAKCSSSTLNPATRSSTKPEVQTLTAFPMSRPTPYPNARESGLRGSDLRSHARGVHPLTAYDKELRVRSGGEASLTTRVQRLAWSERAISYSPA